MDKLKQLGILVAAVLLMIGCGDSRNAPQVEGHYTYEHAFNYDMDGYHLDVHETGTMDFYADGSALDSARQVYVATRDDGDTTTWVYNYISPSQWRLEGEDFYFAGVKETFRMEVTEGNPESDLAQKIIDTYSGSIDHEYKFHLDTLTATCLQWSLTYRDGHSDTWMFHRENTQKP